MTAIGHIYKIICTVDEKFCYIGSTFNRLDKRMKGHRDDYYKWLDGRPRACACCEFFERYGLEKFKIILIKSYEVCRAHNKDRKHLEAYETLWVSKSKCCNKLVPFNPLKRVQRKQYRQDNREAQNAKSNEYYQENKEQISIRRKQRCETIRTSARKSYAKNKEARLIKRKENYALLTPEQKEAINTKKREYRANMTPEQREAANTKQREYRANMTPEQREAKNTKQQEYYANMTPEQREAKNTKQREDYAKKKAQKQAEKLEK